MTELGKYHGQRLKAREVLRLYAAGERDFRGTILRGCNFHGADLSGADFYGADIRSARFVNTTLHSAKFSHAKGGLQRRWWMGQLLLVAAIAGVSGILQGFGGALIGLMLVSSDPATVAAGVAGLVAVMIIFFAIARQGFTLKTLGSVAGAGAGAGAVTVAVAVAFVGFFLSLYINRRIHRGDPKFENLRIIGLALAALGGTTFSGTGLTGATFAHARLKSTNFADSRQQPTILTHVRWHGAEKLDRARLGTSALQDLRIRTLLTTLNGIEQDLTNADLQGANLAGAKLHRANLKGANLNRATLEGAELHGANLTNAQCVGTDFTGAHLTGACLEAWNIDSTTILKDIDCQFVYLLEQPDARGNRERSPHNPNKDFQPGDFEKFFKEMLDTVQILIRNGVDPDAFRTAFEQVMAENPAITRESIQAIEKQGNDVLLTLQVPEGTDKAQVERSWDQGYQLGLEAGYTKGLLEGNSQRADDIKEVALGFGKLLSSIQITNMNTSTNAGDGSFVNTGQMTGNVVNLGELSGQVTVQINQLPDGAAGGDQPSLKDLLAQLQAAVEADPELSEEEKKEALQSVGNLAAAGQNPKENAMQRMAKRAAANLKALVEPLTAASKLAEVCKTLLPTILTLF